MAPLPLPAGCVENLFVTRALRPRAWQDDELPWRPEKQALWRRAKLFPRPLKTL
jgi:hypothetical protein